MVASASYFLAGRAIIADKTTDEPVRIRTYRLGYIVRWPAAGGERGFQNPGLRKLTPEDLRGLPPGPAKPGIIGALREIVHPHRVVAEKVVRSLDYGDVASWWIGFDRQSEQQHTLDLAEITATWN